jgi:hypothetical protein
VHAQVLLVLRWLRHRADLHTLAGDTGVSDATAYRYLHEGLQVIAGHAPDLHDVAAAAHAAGTAYLCLDGTLIPTDRVAARAEAGHSLWYSGKHHAFGGSVQVLSDPTGFPLWVSDVRPGSTHDLTAARELVMWSRLPCTGLAPRPCLQRKGWAGWPLPSAFGDVSPGLMKSGAEHVGVGMAQVLEDAKGLPPGAAGGP